MLLWASAISECASISVFTSLVGIIEGIESSALVLKYFAIIAGVKRCKQII